MEVLAGVAETIQLNYANYVIASSGLSNVTGCVFPNFSAISRMASAQALSRSGCCGLGSVPCAMILSIPGLVTRISRPI